MNIVKFKDQIHPEDSLYNQLLKGKYAFLIHMKYAVPLEIISPLEYNKFEQDIEELTSSEISYWDIQDLSNYIDLQATEQANSLLKFQMQNDYVTDPDITTDEVKQFRSWLAGSLLKLDSDFQESFIRALEYYANNKYNEVIKALSEIQPTEPQIIPNLQECGCHGISVSSGEWNLRTCDVLEIYREHIKSLVASYFQEIDFWTQFPNIFLQEFKSYIDHILRLNLPLSSSQYPINFQDCACLPDKAQQTHQDILKRLSQSLQYLIDQDTMGHKNFISGALKDWATQLYDRMQWA